MARFFILSYIVFFLKILTCLTQHTNFELANKLTSEEDNVEIPDFLIYPWFEEEFDDISPDEYFYDEETVLSPVLSRVRRRIFPGVGKALDRDRSDRNPWVRSRDGHDDENTNSQVMARDGPMGSDLLYEIYPDLAPPDWKDRSIHQPHYVNDPPRLEIRPQNEEGRETTTVIDATSTFKSEKDFRERNGARVRKQKVRIPKKLKEEIAIFAEEHGSAAAVSHFNGKVKFLLRKNAIEKFMRRYKRRQERQRKRRISKS